MSVDSNTNNTERQYGATQSEWTQFDVMLGLTADLLPVVSNPNAKISPNSTMKGLGKTPSRYNRDGQAVGIAEWTKFQADDSDIATWRKQPDYGICVQTRSVRALDIDVEDLEKAERIKRFVREDLGYDLGGARTRSNSGKLLYAFEMPGDFGKRKMLVDGGIIEFLATGQQFIAAGTHPSGVRYEWEGGLPSMFVSMTKDQFEELWSRLEKEFAIEPATTSSATQRHDVLAGAAEHDPTAQALEDLGVVIGQQRDGRLNIECPWKDTHTSDTGEGQTIYFPAYTGGYENGHFHCLHAHCEHRTDAEFREAYSIEPDYSADFDAVEDLPVEERPAEEPVRISEGFILASKFENGPAPRWIIKGVLPDAPIGTIIGPPGSGKSFLAWDMIAAVSQGLPWHERKTKKRRVGILVAEGVAGYRNRIKAYRQSNPAADVDNIVIKAAAPHLKDKEPLIALGKEMKAAGVELLFIDTLSKVSVGLEENSAKDMNLLVDRLALLSEVTGAPVILIHHTGKDVTRGSRGSSAIPGAMEVELLVERKEGYRTLYIKKLKDGEDGEVIPFNLQVVQIGIDEDMDPVTSCVVDYSVKVPESLKWPKGVRYDAIKDTVTDYHEATEEWPSYNEVINAAAAKLPLTAGSKDNRGTNIKISFTKLEEMGVLVVEGGKAKFVGEME